MASLLVDKIRNNLPQLLRVKRCHPVDLMGTNPDSYRSLEGFSGYLEKYPAGDDINPKFCLVQSTYVYQQQALSPF